MVSVCFHIQYVALLTDTPDLRGVTAAVIIGGFILCAAIALWCMFTCCKETNRNAWLTCIAFIIIIAGKEYSYIRSLLFNYIFLPPPLSLCLSLHNYKLDMLSDSRCNNRFWSSLLCYTRQGRKRPVAVGMEADPRLCHHFCFGRCDVLVSMWHFSAL